MTDSDFRPRVVDLFCGAGGMSLGFQAAGFQIVGAVDTDPIAGKTYTRNIKALQPGATLEVFTGDDADLGFLDVQRAMGGAVPEILIGGPPCQAYSRVGRAKLESLSGRSYELDPRISLYEHFVSALRSWQPLAFVMENVPGMMNVRGENRAHGVAAELAEAGYKVGYTLLNAAWYGVPQLRERLFFIGFRRDLPMNPAAPTPSHHVQTLDGYVHRDIDESLCFPFFTTYKLRVSARQAVQPPVTVEDAIGDLDRITDHLAHEFALRRPDFRQPRLYRGPPRSEFARLMRSWPGCPEDSGVDDHEIHRTPRDYETFRRMAPGDRYPQALGIAQQRLQEELKKRAHAGEDLQLESEGYAML